PRPGLRVGCRRDPLGRAGRHGHRSADRTVARRNAEMTEMNRSLLLRGWSGLLDQVMKPVPISQAKAQLSKLVAKALASEQVIIARGKTPLVKLVPLEQPRKPKRQFGALKGKIRFDDRFFDPLPEQELRLWNGEGPDEET